MSLKPALIELKDLIKNHQVESEEKFISDLESKNNLKPGTLVFYFNYLMMMSINNIEQTHQSPDDAKKVNRKWTKAEMDFMFQYIGERQEEGALNITEILEEVALLLNRGYQSVNYKYYTLMKNKDKKQAVNGTPYQFTTIGYESVPVAAAEVIKPEPKAVDPVLVSAPNKAIEIQPSDPDDLIDILSGLITNVQQLPGIQLNELLRSLYQLTNMAIQNQDAVQQIESMKSEISHEKEALKETLRKKEQQLLQEKQRNDDLQLEISKLAKEIHAFNKLGDAAKIQNLKSYNQRLNYIIDEFGMVLRVGS